MSLLTELRRRNVFKVGAAYLIVAWLIAQIVSTLNDPLSLPDWFDTVVVLLLAIGFPLALIFAWAYEITPGGVRPTSSVEPSASITAVTGQRLNYLVTGLLAIAVVMLLVDNYFLDRSDSAAPPGASDDDGPTAPDAQAPTALPLPNSVAVLPFVDQSPDPANAYFADGIHDEILNQLAKIGALNVISRFSVMKPEYSSGEMSIPEIGQELNVLSVMEGNVRYQGGIVRIAARLNDARNNRVLWSEIFERELTNVFDVQAEIAERIADALQLELTDSERNRVGRRLTDSAEALSAYLRGRSLINTSGFELAVGALEEALAEDPDFAATHALLAYMYSSRQQFGLTGDNYALGRSHAEQALAMDQELGLAHAALGELEKLAGDWEAADVAFARAVELSPQSPDVLIPLIRFYADQGDYSAGVRSNELLVQLDPLNPNAHGSMSALYQMAGNTDGAIRHIRRALELAPDSGYRGSIGRVEAAAGNAELASSYLREAERIGIELPPNFVVVMAGYALAGRPADAERVMADLRSFAARNPVRPAIWALAHAALGQSDEAMRYVEQVIANPEPGIELHYLKQNMLELPLLEEPVFVAGRDRIRLGPSR